MRSRQQLGARLDIYVEPELAPSACLDLSQDAAALVSKPEPKGKPKSKLKVKTTLHKLVPKASI